jgi:dihydroxyacetone kinase
MVNNPGATMAMQLTIVARRAFSFLGTKGFKVERIYAGTFLSFLKMGVSRFPF